jgi:hypothetical protein
MMGKIVRALTQDEDKQNNNTTQKTKKLSSSKNVGHHYTQTYIKKIRHEFSYKKLEVK